MQCGVNALKAGTYRKIGHTEKDKMNSDGYQYTCTISMDTVQVNLVALLTIKVVEVSFLQIGCLSAHPTNCVNAMKEEMDINEHHKIFTSSERLHSTPDNINKDHQMLFIL